MSGSESDSMMNALLCGGGLIWNGVNMIDNLPEYTFQLIIHYKLSR